MQLYDALDAATARICQDGSLVAEVFAARTGTQQYRGIEIDPDNAHGLRDKAVATVYRPAAEVFSRDSLASFAAAPVTVDHPRDMVDASNWRRLGVGEINGDIARDGERVRVPLIVRDEEAVRKAQTTHKQLSMGYATKLVYPTDGKHPDGTACDAYQTEIRINHIALVPVARGGPELRVVDERPSEMPSMKIKIGDAEVEVTDGAAVAVAVGTLNQRLTDAETKVGSLTGEVSTLKGQIEAKDGEIVALNAKLVDAEVTPAKLQALADARADVIGKAKVLAPALVTDGKTDADIRKEAVTAKLGDAATSMSDAAIEGAFTALTKDAKPGTVVQPIGAPVVAVDAATAYVADREKQRRALSDAWRTPFNPADAAA